MANLLIKNNREHAVTLSFVPDSVPAKPVAGKITVTPIVLPVTVTIPPARYQTIKNESVLVPGSAIVDRSFVEAVTKKQPAAKALFTERWLEMSATDQPLTEGQRVLVEDEADAAELDSEADDLAALAEKKKQIDAAAAAAAVKK